MPGMNDPIEQNMSMLNPTDLTMMAQEKKFSKDMTVEEFLRKIGISPQDPVQKLMEFGKQQVKNANPMNKAMNMAQNIPKSSEPPQGQGQGLDTLLNGM